MENIQKLTRVIISSILGHHGDGMLPYLLRPGYRKLLKIVKETNTATITKSATAKKFIGNFDIKNPLTWRCVRYLPNGGILNAFGLTNHGAADCSYGIAKARYNGFNAIPSFFPEFARCKNVPIEEVDELREALDDDIEDILFAIEWYESSMEKYFEIIELNISCANSKENIGKNTWEIIKLIKAIQKKFPDLKLIIKLSILHPYEFVEELDEMGVYAIHGINAIPYNIVYPDSVSPLVKFGGGAVSGGPVYEMAFKHNKELRKKIKNAKFIGGCGISNLDHAKYYFEEVGADHISIATVVSRNIKEAEKIILKYNA